MIKVYDLVIFGVKEYRKIRNQNEKNEDKNYGSNVSYIDSCRYQTFKPKQMTSRGSYESKRRFNVADYQVSNSQKENNFSEKNEKLKKFDNTFGGENKENIASNNYNNFQSRYNSKESSISEFQTRKTLENYESFGNKNSQKTHNFDNMDHLSVPKITINHQPLSTLSHESLNPKTQVLQEHQKSKNFESKFESNLSVSVQDLSIICFDTLKAIIKE